MNSIHIKPSHEGLLHERLGIKKGHKINLGTLMRDKAHAKREGNGKEVKQDTFAINAKHWHH